MELSEWTIDRLEVGLSESIEVEITEELIGNFAKLTGDFHPLHTDNEYSQVAGFDTIIAHGALLSSLASSLIGMRIPGKNALIASQKFDFKLPVLANESVVFTATVEKIEARFSLIDVAMKLVNRTGKTVANGKYQIMVRTPVES